MFARHYNSNLMPSHSRSQSRMEAIHPRDEVVTQDFNFIPYISFRLIGEKSNEATSSTSPVANLRFSWPGLESTLPPQYTISQTRTSSQTHLPCTISLLGPNPVISARCVHCLLPFVSHVRFLSASDSRGCKATGIDGYSSRGSQRVIFRIFEPFTLLVKICHVSMRSRAYTPR